MAILKTDEGLIQLDKCPVCGYLVKQSDMHYENEKPIICKFCDETTTTLLIGLKWQTLEKDIRP